MLIQILSTIALILIFVKAIIITVKGYADANKTVEKVEIVLSTIIITILVIGAMYIIWLPI